ncbi:FxSxx-COOH protein [Actinoallomurus purpureus]|uniref:FxSxx-COOH cyclophane-containing RiPP peptide n=1 Tax=Actinoallomurus purpureus TaxID=478114 RepID=UPI002093E4DB|nr:FxSxx-COOH cyclophane-containing RiPP peptide [Actinoallomurus purpureus]MCO6003634.1 FxSxx-COOH protein [Actinoallomurus purpureus]
MDDSDPVFRSGLIDISGIDLDRLRDLPDSMFSATLRRILEESEDGDGLFVGFQNIHGGRLWHMPSDTGDV